MSTDSILSLSLPCQFIIMMGLSIALCIRIYVSYYPENSMC
uniref:Uncharacterized protein n=1 Tax=Rhizophora mucronata TaxID=61149 RepID=A0A2P2QHS4_RHIMU